MDRKIVRVKIDRSGFLEYVEQATKIPLRQLDLRLDKKQIGIGFGVYPNDFDPKEEIRTEYTRLRRQYEKQ